MKSRVLSIEPLLGRLIVLWLGKGRTLCAGVCRVKSIPSRNIAPIVTSIEGGPAGRARGRGVGEAAIRRRHLTAPTGARRRRRCRHGRLVVTVVTPIVVVVVSWTSGVAPLLCYISINIRLI